MYWAIKSHPHYLRHAACIVAVGLVDFCLQYRPHVSRLDTDHRLGRFGKCAEDCDDGAVSNPLEAVGRIPQSMLRRLAANASSWIQTSWVGSQRTARNTRVDLVGDSSKKFRFACRRHEVVKHHKIGRATDHQLLSARAPEWGQ